MKRISFLLLVLTYLSVGLSAAEQAEVITYYDSPHGDYKEFRVTNALSAGMIDADPGTITIGTGSYTAAFFGGFNIWNNDIPGHLAASRGGGLTVSGSLDIQDEAGNSLLYVNAVTDRVGVGTRAPQAPLDVRGEVKAISVFAYTAPLDNTQPYAEISTEVAPERFGGGYRWTLTFPHKYRFCTVHVDGDPLVFQTIVKGSHEIGGLGRGELIINGKQIGYNAVGNKVIFVVGEPFNYQDLSPDPIETPEYNPGDYPTGPSPTYTPSIPPAQAFAHAWYQYSSREYKKDIVPLAAADYKSLLSSLATTDVVRYLLKSQEAGSKLRIGMIAEDVPDDLASEDRKAIGLGEQAAFLMAAAKTLRNEQQDMRRRIERLKES